MDEKIRRAIRPPLDPYLQKGRPTVNPEVSRETGIAETLNRGHQILLELDRQHERLRNAVEDALKPDPRAWKGAKAAKAGYDQAYSELMALSKRLDVVIQEEAPELMNPPPPQAGRYGFRLSQNACTKIDGQSSRVVSVLSRCNCSETESLRCKG